jgi:hypothetical protein
LQWGLVVVVKDDLEVAGSLVNSIHEIFPPHWLWFRRYARDYDTGSRTKQEHISVHFQRVRT